MRYILVLLISLLTAYQAHAVKAYPFPVEVHQPDGTMLTVVLHGDEDFHYYTTADGVLLVQQPDGYYVAATDAAGRLRATAQLAHDAVGRSWAERALVQSQDVEAFLVQGREEGALRRVMREPVSTSGTPFFPHTGSPKPVVLLVEFADVHFSLRNPVKSFDQYFNSMKSLEDLGAGESSNASSVRKYFSDVSFGQFQPQFDVYGPVTMPDSLKSYGGTRSDGKDEDMLSLFKNACTKLDSEVDFSRYDSNNDGSVDLVIIIYAGYSQAMGGNTTDCIWPKSGITSAGTYDGKSVARYAVSAELNGFPDCWEAPPYQRINGTGTLSHEFCHTMGLPDFYPTVSSVKGNNQAMEFWSLMDSGNYLINGYCPVALNAWEREAFGWITIPTLKEACDLDIKALDDGGTAYRILNDNDPSGKEYFIVENIQNVGPNMRQKGHGLLAYHVWYDAKIFANNKANNVKGKPRMTVVPADGLLFAQYNVGRVINGVKVTNADFYDQLAGDPFPGTSGVTEINDTLDLVNYRVYTGSAFNKGFEQIVEHDGVVSLRFINDFQAHRLGYCALGDANHDGSVDVTDIMTLVKVILHQPVPAYYPYNADMDANGQVNVTDVMSICNLLLGK